MSSRQRKGVANKDIIKKFEDRKRKENVVRNDKIPITKIPEKIVGATDSRGQLELYFKFRGIEEPVLIPSKEANLKYPQIVIEYYQGKLVWDPPSKKCAKLCSCKTII